MEDDWLSSGVVQVDVPFMELKALYIVSLGDAPFVMLLKASCVVSSICSLSSCMDVGCSCSLMLYWNK